jgi:hypothetical protein
MLIYRDITGLYVHSAQGHVNSILCTGEILTVRLKGTITLKFGGGGTGFLTL